MTAFVSFRLASFSVYVSFVTTTLPPPSSRTTISTNFFFRFSVFLPFSSDNDDGLLIAKMSFNNKGPVLVERPSEMEENEKTKIKINWRSAKNDEMNISLFFQRQQKQKQQNLKRTNKNLRFLFVVDKKKFLSKKNLTLRLKWISWIHLKEKHWFLSLP